MTLRDLSDAQIATAKTEANASWTQYFTARHTSKTPNDSFLAGFNAGFKHALSLFPGKVDPALKDEEKKG